MEKAYRRGVQQTLCLSEEGKIPDWILKDDGYSYRYEKPLGTSTGLDGFVTTSRERLEIESAKTMKSAEFYAMGIEVQQKCRKN